MSMPMFLTRRLLVTGVLVGALAAPLLFARQAREDGRASRRESGDRARGTASREPSAPPPALVVPAPMPAGGIVHVLGRVRALPELTAQVTAPIWGRVVFQDEPLAIGQVVKKGQPLLKVVLELSATERYLLESRTIEIASAVGVARTRLQEADREYRRAIALLKVEPNNRFRRQQVISTEKVYNAANEEKTLYERQEKSYATVLQRRDPRITVVEAPIGGYVTEMGVTAGEVIPTGQFRRVCTIADLSRVWIEADVYEAAIGDVLSGVRAAYSLQENGAARAFGKPVAVMPWLDEQARTLKVIYEVPNPGTELRLGMTVHVTFQHGAGGGR